MTDMLKTIFLASRPPFLILTPVCVLLACALVIAGGDTLNPILTGMCLLCALMAHMSVNLLNEYTDFKTGLDLHTTRTPFSGGSGALPDFPDHAEQVRLAGLVTLLGSVASGLYLVYDVGFILLPFGLAGVLLVSLYSPWINRYPFLCLLSPGFGFGFCVVLGSFVCLTGNVTVTAVLVSLLPFFVINNLLLINQFPDTHADKKFGRRHGVIVYGQLACVYIYCLFTAFALAVLILLVFTGWIPVVALFVLPLFILPCISAYGAFRFGTGIGKYPGYLAANVLFSLLFPGILSLLLLVV